MWTHSVFEHIFFSCFLLVCRWDLFLFWLCVVCFKTITRPNEKEEEEEKEAAVEEEEGKNRHKHSTAYHIARVCWSHSSRVFCHSNWIACKHTQTNPLKRINIYICIYLSSISVPQYTIYIYIYTHTEDKRTKRSCCCGCAQESDVLNTCDFLNCHAVLRDRRRENKSKRNKPVYVSL